ncbi:hypothetical protein NDU88_001928 [Pleurodeles waltl]|uniref:Uncharacterized protein n=1 Tax=Pleurodeles waltl TaxID=8319 RepID=A0AAV7VDB3_PLEWA|nr:hypothetical protein NDU88_001928 [Pleurodeles waltl]
MQRLQFSLLTGSRASFTGPRQSSTRGFFYPWWAALEALLLRWTSSLTPGAPLSILAGPEHLPPAVGTSGSQSHCARSRTAALVPGHGVGR